MIAYTQNINSEINSILKGIGMDESTRENLEVMGRQVEAKEFFSASTEDESDDTSVEEIAASLKLSLQQIKRGETIPLSQLWDGIDDGWSLSNADAEIVSEALKDPPKPTDQVIDLFKGHLIDT